MSWQARSALCLVGALIGGVGALGAAGGANAATLHAHADGKGPRCTATKPCRLTTAVDRASSGDVVLVGRGRHRIDGLAIEAGVVVRGKGPQSRATLFQRGEGFVDVSGPGAVLRNVRVRFAEARSGLRVSHFGLAERLTVTGSPQVACRLERGALIRDSLCWTRHPVGTGVFSYPEHGDSIAWVRNVTAITAYTGFWAHASDHDQHVVLDARNVISRGLWGGAAMTEAVSTASAELVLANSNFARTYTDGTGTETVSDPGANENSSAAPLFVDERAGDFRQAPGSPTLDAGALDARTGPLALGGGPRVLGPAPDVGAYEGAVQRR